MPLQALQRQVIFSTTQKSLKIFTIVIGDGFKGFPLQKKSVSKEREIIQQEIECTKIVQTIDYFWCFRRFISWNTVSR